MAQLCLRPRETGSRVRRLGLTLRVSRHCHILAHKRRALFAGCRLQVCDIDSERKVIHIRAGKGTADHDFVIAAARAEGVEIGRLHALRDENRHKSEMLAMRPSGLPPWLNLGDEASSLDRPLDQAACSAGY